MNPSTLTIGQLAAHVGVTVRAVRHYHARGLLREPDRDASGYRRYDAQAVVDLVRIKTLADAGVPLARIGQLLDAAPAEFNAAIAAIDQVLQTKIRDMQQHRRQLAELAGGDRLFLPAAIVDMLDQLRSLGVSERTVQMERDGWILVAALSPQFITDWVDQKKTALADPDFRRLYLAADQARDWDPADPRLDQLAESMADFAAHQPEPRTDPPEGTVDESVAVSLLSAYVTNASPAWRRMSAMAKDKLQEASVHPH